MKNKFYLLFLFFCAFSPALKAISYLDVLNTSRAGVKTSGTIKDIQCDITPNGLYAQIELTFKIYATQNNMISDADQLEAVMNFDLPSNSFVHDSWLWLDDTTIIQADIIEKEKAKEIYEGIVKRRRDPSILYKVSENKYEFHVYPMYNKVPRKVKIVYSTPFLWRGNKAYINYPVDLLLTSYDQQSSISSVVHYNSIYTNPQLLEAPIANYVLSSTANSVSLYLNSNLYNGNRDINLYYTVNTSQPLIFNYAISANEGYYQIAVPPVAAKLPKHIDVLLDHSSYATSSTTFNDVKRHLITFLTTNYDENDSFNIFYLQNDQVKKVGASWRPLSQASILSAVNSVPTAITSDHRNFVSAVQTSYQFCKTRQDAELVIFACHPNNLNDTAATTAFNNIQNAVQGFANNKIHVVNYAISGTSSAISDEALLRKLVYASHGVYFQAPGTLYRNPLTATANYDFDIRNALCQVAAASGYETNVYNITLPINGIAYSRYNINANNKLSLECPYLETGKYYGSFPITGNITLDYLDASGLQTVQSSYNVVNAGSEPIKKAWLYNYLTELEAMGNFYYKEALDSSMNNRVLCNYTAFLALETGDTIHASINSDDEGPIATSVITKEKNTFSVYPNPCTAILTIQSNEPIQRIEIYDLLGKLYYVEDKIGKNKVDINTNAFTSGFYFVKVFGEKNAQTIKVQKL